MAIGNLGKDCNVNTVNGKNVINFSIAHTEKFKDSTGAQREKTTWVECAYWVDRTGISPFLKKGTQVYVEGTPEVRTYQTNDGKSGASLSLRVHSVQLLGSKTEGLGNVSPQSNERSYEGGNNSGSSTVSNPGNNYESNEASDDLPF